MYLTDYSDWLTDFREPVLSPFRCHTPVWKMSSAITGLHACYVASTVLVLKTFCKFKGGLSLKLRGAILADGCVEIRNAIGGQTSYCRVWRKGDGERRLECGVNVNTGWAIFWQQLLWILLCCCEHELWIQQYFDNSVLWTLKTIYCLD